MWLSSKNYVTENLGPHKSWTTLSCNTVIGPDRPFQLDVEQLEYGMRIRLALLSSAEQTCRSHQDSVMFVVDYALGIVTLGEVVNDSRLW